MNRDNIPPVSPPNAPVSPPDTAARMTIEKTARHANMLLTYSRNNGLSPHETLFSMVLCVAMLANTLEIDEGTVCAGIHAALSDLNPEDEAEE